MSPLYLLLLLPLISLPAAADQDQSTGRVYLPEPKPSQQAESKSSQQPASSHTKSVTKPSVAQQTPRSRWNGPTDYMDPSSISYPWRYLGGGGWASGPRSYVFLGRQRVDLPTTDTLLATISRPVREETTDYGPLSIMVMRGPGNSGENGLGRCGGNRGQGQGNICDPLNPDNPSNPEDSNLPSVPGPLPIAGAGVAFGFARQLRHRIKK